MQTNYWGLSPGKKILYLLFPFGMVLWGGLNYKYLSASLAGIGVYYLWTTSIQNGIPKKELLLREKELTNNSEQIIHERTEVLMDNNEQLFNLSNQDVVTGIANRRRFYQLLERMAGHLRHGERISLIFMNINDFSKIANRYGTHVREKVLANVAKRLQFYEWRYKDAVLANYREDIFVIAVPGGIRI